MTSSLLAKLALICTAAIWGSTFFIIRDSISLINPLVLVSYRFLLAAGTLAIVLLIQKKSLFQSLRQGSILGMLMAVVVTTQSWGLQYTSATNSGFITGLMILFVPVFSYLLWRKKIGFWQLLPIILAMIGLYLLVGGINHINQGDIITLITAMSYSLYIIYAQSFTKVYDIWRLNFQQCLTIGIISLVIAWVSNISLIIPLAQTGPSIAYLALIATCLAFSLQLIGQKKTTALQAAMILATEPLFATFFAWSLGGEHISSYQIIGGCMIFSALVSNEYIAAKSA